LQAYVLGLYDPARAKTPTHNGVAAGYDDFLAELVGLRESLNGRWGRGLALLIGPETSPTLKAQLATLQQQFPEMRLSRHVPLGTPDADAAVRATVGAAGAPIHHFVRASLILSLDGDFLGEGPGRLAYARQFADARRVTGQTSTMSRLYALGSSPTLTTAAADHFRRLNASEMGNWLARLEQRLDGGGDAADPLIEALADDLSHAGPHALIVAGGRLDAATQAQALRLNSRLGAIGTTLDFIPPPEIGVEAGDLYALNEAIARG